MLQWSFPLRQIKVFAYTVSRAEYAYIHVMQHYALDFDACMMSRSSMSKFAELQGVAQCSACLRTTQILNTFVQDKIHEEENICLDKKDL